MHALSNATRVVAGKPRDEQLHESVLPRGRLPTMAPRRLGHDFTKLLFRPPGYWVS